MNPHQLSRIVLRGFKSIRECDLELKELNVLIGPNGAGKSNFITLFRLVQQLLEGKLQLYVNKQGGPDALLHFGRKTTERLRVELYFGVNGYKVTLEPTQDNRMIFAEENVWFNQVGDYTIGAGYFESEVESHKEHKYIYDKSVGAMKSWRLYHFHDTGESALVKQRHAINDNEYLRPDARNLGAFLFRLQKNYPAHFDRIEALVRCIAPFFGGFHLRPDTDNAEFIELEWLEIGEDKPFKAHQLSDGTLRFICLATVLNQPEEFLPQTILIDEPELGLHPRAIGFLASMLRSVAKQRQIIISTQSVTLVNGFSIDDLVVVDRKEEVTVFNRYQGQEFEEWLREYTVGDLWEKNVLGGRG